MRFYLPKAVEARSQAEDPDWNSGALRQSLGPGHSLQIHRFDTVVGFGNLYQDNAALDCWEPKGEVRQLNLFDRSRMVKCI